MPPLKSFTRNSQVIKFNRVVAYGCSHTAGSELADHLFCEPKMTAKELDKIKRSYKNPTDFYAKYPLPGREDVIEAQQKLTWAGKVADATRL
jgi:hypothetical protein